MIFCYTQISILFSHHQKSFLQQQMEQMQRKQQPPHLYISILSPGPLDFSFITHDPTPLSHPRSHVHILLRESLNWRSLSNFSHHFPGNSMEEEAEFIRVSQSHPHIYPISFPVSDFQLVTRRYVPANFIPILRPLPHPLFIPDLHSSYPLPSPPLLPISTSL